MIERDGIFVTSGQLLFVRVHALIAKTMYMLATLQFSFMHQKFENFNIFHRGKNSIFLVQFSHKRITISKFAELTLEFIKTSGTNFVAIFLFFVAKNNF